MNKQEKLKKLREIANPGSGEILSLVEKLEMIKGDKGESPTKEELVQIIKPLIPPPIKGDKGDSIKPTREELESIIKPLIPDPIKGDKGESIKGDKPSLRELEAIIKPLIPAPLKGDKGNDAPALDTQKFKDEIYGELKKKPISEIADVKDLVKFLRAGGFRGGGGSATTGVSSVSNSDGTLTISPTTGSVVASLALGHSNTWTASQRFPRIGINKAALVGIGIDLLTTSGGQGFRIENPAASDIAFSTFVTGDAQLRFSFLGDGTLKWGGGTSPADTNLYRLGVNILKTDSEFVSASAILAGTFVGVGSNGTSLNESILYMWDGATTISITAGGGAFSTTAQFYANGGLVATEASGINTVINTLTGILNQPTTGGLRVDLENSTLSLGSHAIVFDWFNGFINSPQDFSLMGNLKLRTFQDATPIVHIDFSGTFNAAASLSFDSIQNASLFKTVQLKGITANRALVTDGSQYVTASATTATEIGYVSGVTSAIQTQLNARVSSVSGTTNRITSTGGATPVIDISASYVGQSSITTLGTITTGVWNGTAIANANLANSTISGVALGGTLAALTATNASLTFSGSYTGATARTVGINLGNTNSWTIVQNFLAATSGIAAVFQAAATTPGDVVDFKDSAGTIQSRITPGGWMQNTAGRARLTAQVTNATATMANLTDLTLTLVAGRKYFGQMMVFANNSVTGEGIQFDFGGGTATFTSIEFGFAAAVGATLVAATSTAAATAITSSKINTTDDVFLITFAFVVNAGGTFIPRFAENTHVVGTATIQLNGYLWIEDSPN